MEYSAVMTNHSFWFLETKKTAQLILDDFSREDIVNISVKDNIYQVKSERRKRDLPNAFFNRLKDFNNEGLELFLNCSNDSAKLFVILCIMRSNRLFFEFMYEVYREHLILQENILKDGDLNIFFNEKKNQSEKVANWSDRTVKDLKDVFVNFLKAAGLIKLENNERVIVPPFVDYNLQDYLIDNDLKPYLICLTGEE